MRLYRYPQTRLRRRSKTPWKADGGWADQSERRRAARQHYNAVGKGKGFHWWQRHGHSNDVCEPRSADDGDDA